MSLFFLSCLTLGILLGVLIIIGIFSLLSLAQKGDAYLDKLAGCNLGEPAEFNPERLTTREFSETLLPKSKPRLDRVPPAINKDFA